MLLFGVTFIRWTDSMINGISHQHVLSYNSNFRILRFAGIEFLKIFRSDILEFFDFTRQLYKRKKNLSINDRFSLNFILNY